MWVKNISQISLFHEIQEHFVHMNISCSTVYDVCLRLVGDTLACIKVLPLLFLKSKIAFIAISIKDVGNVQHTKRKVVEKSSKMLPKWRLYGCHPKGCQGCQPLQPKNRHRKIPTLKSWNRQLFEYLLTTFCFVWAWIGSLLEKEQYILWVSYSKSSQPFFTIHHWSAGFDT